MESTITGTVGEVVGRTVNTRTGPAPIFDVTIGSQKVSTFKAPVAEEAKALQGSTVEATVDVTEKNGYTNYTLLSLKLMNAVGTSVASSTIPIAAASDYQRRMEPEVEARVTRLACLSTAFQFCGATGLNREDALALAQQLYGVAMGKQEPVAVAAEPVEVTDEVPW